MTEPNFKNQYKLFYLDFFCFVFCFICTITIPVLHFLINSIESVQCVTHCKSVGCLAIFLSSHIAYLSLTAVLYLLDSFLATFSNNCIKRSFAAIGVYRCKCSSMSHFIILDKKKIKKRSIFRFSF